MSKPEHRYKPIDLTLEPIIQAAIEAETENLRRLRDGPPWRDTSIDDAVQAEIERLQTIHERAKAEIQRLEQQEAEPPRPKGKPLLSIVPTDRRQALVAWAKETIAAAANPISQGDFWKRAKEQFGGELKRGRARELWHELAPSDWPRGKSPGRPKADNSPK